jgi:hypothetical protein
VLPKAQGFKDKIPLEVLTFLHPETIVIRVKSLVHDPLFDGNLDLHSSLFQGGFRSIGAILMSRGIFRLSNLLPGF